LLNASNLKQCIFYNDKNIFNFQFLNKKIALISVYRDHKGGESWMALVAPKGSAQSGFNPTKLRFPSRVEERNVVPSRRDIPFILHGPQAFDWLL